MAKTLYTFTSTDKDLKKDDIMFTMDSGRKVAKKKVATCNYRKPKGVTKKFSKPTKTVYTFKSDDKGLKDADITFTSEPLKSVKVTAKKPVAKKVKLVKTKAGTLKVVVKTAKAKTAKKPVAKKKPAKKTASKKPVKEVV